MAWTIYNFDDEYTSKPKHVTPQNTQEAVELGLYLAVTADTEQGSKEALELAKGLAQELNYAEVQEAKRNVAVRIERERQTRSNLSDVIGAISPAETPFEREAREMDISLHEWEAAKAKYMPKPKRLTRELILDAIGCPNLIMKRVVHRFENSGHKIGWKFVYLHHDPLTSIIPESVGELHVDHPRLKDLTLEQWVENGQLLVDQVENA